MLKLRRLSAALCTASVLALPAWVGAATDIQKQAAIDNGLGWLAATQAANGSWPGSGYGAADTSSALLAFIDQRVKPGGWNDPAAYNTAVTNGLNYLLSQATQVNVGVRPDGKNADVGGSGHGLYWGALSETTYISGLAMSALGRAVSSGLVSASTTISSSNAAVNGKTYGQVLQESVNMYLAGQTTAAGGVYRGGWHYYPSQGDADNSTTQWAAIGMLFAQQAGAVIPQYTKDELKFWIDYIQNSTSGGSGYNSPTYLVNESKTGGLLVEMAFSGYDGNAGTPNDTGGNSTKAGALAYLNTQWQTVANNTWDGNFGHPYAMWSVYKGLESTIGLGNTTAITHLHAQGTAQLDLGDTWNWWEDYSESLVASQAAAGNWSGYGYWPSAMSTAWNINILNGTRVGPDPSVPEPAGYALVGAALLALAATRRHRGA